ncbi:hypothetical protein F9L04_25095 [Brucella anthropi]|uniref:Uncharacterized protein n=1 Tax=Brucella anthropi TaxID=529 RepID=A0A6L3YYD4_BRUAN|nr:hypothetical protein F9L04_25095 [Brucella anthropi]
MLRHGDHGRVHAAAAAEQPELQIFEVRSRANVAERANDIAVFANAVADDPATASRALAEVAQVIGENVVAGLVQVLVVRHKIDFDVVAARLPGVAVRLQVPWEAVAIGPDRMVGDNQLVVVAWDEPALDRDAVRGREVDVFERDAVIRRRTQDRRTRRVLHSGDEAGDELRAGRVCC